jgi:cytoskeletal protein CcmA (bactofilin family)
MMDRKQSNDQYAANESIVGASVKIDGDLKSQGNLRIDGTVTGKVKTSQNLFVGESALISADIEAENAVIGGTVQGNIKVSGALQLTRTARLTGDMNCGTLQVEQGAMFIGKCQMRDTENNVQPVSEK